MTAFSYSFLDTYHNVCPKQAFHKFIARDVKYNTSTQQAGIDHHEAFKSRLLDGKPLPAEYAHIEPIMSTLVRPGLKLAIELKLGVDKAQMACEFFDDGARYRAVPDVVAYGSKGTGLSLDWKTGKPRDNSLQHEINAYCIFKGYPRINELTCANVYTKTGHMGEKVVYTRDRDMTWLLAKLERLSGDIEYHLNAVPWPARKSPLCGWCPVSTCENWKPRT